MKWFTTFPRPLMNILNSSNYWRTLLKLSFHCEKWPLITVLFLVFYVVIKTSCCASVEGLWEHLEDQSTLYCLYHSYPHWLTPSEGSDRIVRHDVPPQKLRWLFLSLSCLALSWILYFTFYSFHPEITYCPVFLPTFFLGLMVYLPSAMSLARGGYKR